MKISEVMVKKPITVKPDVLIYEAAKLMRDKKISSVIVVDKGIVKGILTERDLIRRVLAENKDPNKVKIDEVMTSPIVSISPNKDILDAAQLMKTKGIRRLVVMEDEKLVGIITTDDMIKNMKRAVEEFATMLYLSQHV
ncbi:MAG: CBS domain-containing protein [Candidatus Bathyarchaeota archaeon]